MEKVTSTFSADFDQTAEVTLRLERRESPGKSPNNSRFSEQKQDFAGPQTLNVWYIYLHLP